MKRSNFGLRSSGTGIRSPAFTLVELLIVIVILGILVAVAVPQFGTTSTDAKVTALDQNLRCIRKAIERYSFDHNNRFPGRVVATHRTLVTLLSHADALDAFTKQLTYYSDAQGNTSTKKSSTFPYGPYLRTGVPANPLPYPGTVSNPASVKVTADTRPLRADAAPTTGWKTSYATGQFIANHPDYDTR